MPLLKFDTTAGMVAPDTAELREAVARNWELAFRRDGAPTIDTDPSTPAGQLVDAEASYLAGANSEFLFLSQQFNPRVAEGPWQDGIGYIYFLERKIAQPTLVTVECTGLPGTVIPRGAQIRTAENVRYECIQDTALPENGTTGVLFRGVEAGPIECQANALMNFTGTDAVILTAASGWETINNEVAGITGHEASGTDPATATSVVVTCGAGPNGTVIPQNAQIQLVDGYVYSTESDSGIVAVPGKIFQASGLADGGLAIAADGKASVTFVCTETGAVEVPKGALSNAPIKGSGSIVTVIPGWDTIRNTAAGVPGWHRESQWDFENRRYLSVAKNAHGTVESLQGTIWDVEDVVDCRVLENPMGHPVTKHGVTIPAHSVAISVFGGANEDIAKAIYQKKDAGCGTCLNEPGFKTVTYADEEASGAAYSYGIIRPDETDVFITVRYHETDTTPAGIEAAIKQAVYRDFYGENEDSGNVRVGMAQTLYASRFAVAVVKTAQVPDLVSIEVGFSRSSMGSSIVIDGWTEPVLQFANIEVEKE